LMSAMETQQQILHRRPDTVQRSKHGNKKGRLAAPFKSYS
jgi:hypothetical protein